MNLNLNFLIYLKIKARKIKSYLKLTQVFWFSKLKRLDNFTEGTRQK